ncbi:MAG TPA: cation transporter, partial [Cytophagales bacterium]|nr:cation transporter [Cytophagales bacterium]
MFNRVVQFFLDHTLLTVLLGLGLLAWGLAVAPFEWAPTGWPRDPIAVDAIPDLGENQQIVVAEWPGRSPQDLEDQVTYPLTTALLGVPGVQTIRSTTLFGVASLYLIFKEGEDFYDARSRVLEKLSALSGALPEGVQPVLGPDATALGQVFWYTLEGRDANGRPTGGWNPQDLRSIQDYYVGPALAAADGVAEVASIGGYVKEYQVELDPHSLHRYGIALPQVMAAVRHSNQDVGAGTLEVNRVEYLIRGLGTVKSAQDLEETLVVNYEGVPVRLGDVARVQVGPAPRRGGLDKAGAEAVGGVVVARFGANPLE